MYCKKKGGLEGIRTDVGEAMVRSRCLIQVRAWPLVVRMLEMMDGRWLRETGRRRQSVCGGGEGE